MTDTDSFGMTSITGVIGGFLRKNASSTPLNYSQKLFYALSI